MQIAMPYLKRRLLPGRGKCIPREMLKAGWAKLKDIKRDPTEADLKKREIEAEAKAAGKGIWNPHGPKVDMHCQCIVNRLNDSFVGSCCALHHA